MGKLGEDATSDFYEKVGEFAKDKGIIISVISIKGSDTRLENIGSLADITRYELLFHYPTPCFLFGVLKVFFFSFLRGSVDLVEPSNLNFERSVSSTVIATHCTLKFFLHPTLQFKNEDSNLNGNNKSQVVLNLGNVSKVNLLLHFPN